MSKYKQEEYSAVTGEVITDRQALIQAFVFWFVLIAGLAVDTLVMLYIYGRWFFPYHIDALIWCLLWYGSIIAVFWPLIKLAIVILWLTEPIKTGKKKKP